MLPHREPRRPGKARDGTRRRGRIILVTGAPEVAAGIPAAAADEKGLPELRRKRLVVQVAVVRGAWDEGRSTYPVKGLTSFLKTHIGCSGALKSTHRRW